MAMPAVSLFFFFFFIFFFVILPLSIHRSLFYFRNVPRLRKSDIHTCVITSAFLKDLGGACLFQEALAHPI